MANTMPWRKGDSPGTACMARLPCAGPSTPTTEAQERSGKVEGIETCLAYSSEILLALTSGSASRETGWHVYEAYVADAIPPSEGPPEWRVCFGTIPGAKWGWTVQDLISVAVGVESSAC